MTNLACNWHAIPLVLAAWLAIAGCGNSRQAELENVAGTLPELETRNGKIVLGSAGLTSGIPGEGPLRSGEIRAWLAAPGVHDPLEVALPFGLEELSDEAQIPEDNPLTRAKIELGRQLFFDGRIGEIVCGDCHQPRYAFSAYQVFPETGMNSMSAFNRLFGREQFWVGRVPSLEEQPIVPVENIYEMATSPEEIEQKLQDIEGYRLQFEAAFGQATFEDYCRALACFQRSLVSGPSPYDFHAALQELSSRNPEDWSEAEREQHAWLSAQSSQHPFSEQAERGQELFFSDRLACGECHLGPNFTDEDYHNLGIGLGPEDLHRDGRQEVTGREEDWGAFKTPTLRNVALTPPYMHNGEFPNLEQVIDFFDQGGNPNSHLSSLIQPLGLSEQEKLDLLAFLNALTSPLPPVEQGRLPE